MNTTKAALCPICQQFHLIASIDAFNNDDKTRKEFLKLENEGFSIVEVSTQEAKTFFGYCDEYVTEYINQVLDKISLENIEWIKSSDELSENERQVMLYHQLVTLKKLQGRYEPQALPVEGILQYVEELKGFLLKSSFNRQNQWLCTEVTYSEKYVKIFFEIDESEEEPENRLEVFQKNYGYNEYGQGWIIKKGSFHITLINDLEFLHPAIAHHHLDILITLLLNSKNKMIDYIKKNRT